MARKPAPKKSPAPKTPAAVVAAPAPKIVAVEAEPVGEPVAQTAVRKTVAPKAPSVAVAKKAAPITHERIAERAYYISLSGTGGSEHDNWMRAEAELNGESL